MSEDLQEKIVKFVNGGGYRAMKPRSLAREMGVHDEKSYPRFKNALRSVIDGGRIGIGKSGNVVANAKVETTKARGPMGAGAGVSAPGKKQQGGQRGDMVTGVYRQNKRGFGF